MSRINVRRSGQVYYVTFRCTARGCGLVWKSSYFKLREIAREYAARAPQRGRRARCPLHREAGR